MRCLSRPEISEYCFKTIKKEKTIKLVLRCAINLQSTSLLCTTIPMLESVALAMALLIFSWCKSSTLRVLQNNATKLAYISHKIFFYMGKSISLRFMEKNNLNSI